MIDWQQRVVEERRELGDKALKLAAFICGAGYDGLDRVNQKMLNRQHVAMKEYLDILDIRIKLFGSKV